MKYSAALRTSRRPHILKHHSWGGLLSLSWLLVVLVLLYGVVRLSSLDISDLTTGFLVSLARTSAAYLVALVVAVVLALVTTINAATEALLLPILDVAQSFPSFALFPLLLHALNGHSELIILAVLSINIMWSIIFAIVAAIKNRREDLEEAARVFGAVGWKRLWHFSLPELRPAIVTGSIVGWGEGWDMLIGAELLVHVRLGIGRYLGDLGDNGQTTLLAFGIVFMMLLLFILNKLIWLPLLHRTTKFQSEN